jgi:hypothetical protein
MMTIEELKHHLERGKRKKHNIFMFYGLNRLNGHWIISSACKAIYCVLFGRSIYYQPRKWQRFI